MNRFLGVQLILLLVACFVSSPHVASVYGSPKLPARVETGFFNGKDLTGWKSNGGYWSVKDGAIVGHSDKNIAKNEFIWSDVEVQDFYLAVDVKLTPGDRNAGIQFRSKPVDTHGQALGYQADVGHDQVIGNCWGNLYHEHGRGKLDWNNRAVRVVKKGDWNRYEILAVGHRIWTAINGKLCVAIEDPKGELSGKIAFQIHAGPPQTVHYRKPTLIHNPKIELAGLSEKELLAELPKKELPYWSKLIAGVDPGSQNEAWAKPTFDDGSWKTMKVPGHFDTVELPGFDGVVWFRKTFELSREQAKAAATLHLGQIDDMDVTWMNGTRVGGYEIPGHHYTVRKYPVRPGLLKPGKNVIAVRVMDHGAPGGIAGTPEQLFLQLNDERISLANRWHFAPGANLAALNKYGQVPALLRPLSRPKTPVPAFADGFAINSDQTIVILGSTNALETDRHGHLETLFTAAHPQHRVRVRNLSWQADTVYQQQRPRNFYATNKPNYGERDGRRQIKADIVLFWMGQSESLDGPQRVDEFKTAYRRHIDQISDYTKRIVLVTPVPFSNPLRLEIDIQKLNKSLAVYVDAIRQIGRDRKLLVVDLATAFGSGATPLPHSRNGLHLLPAGHWDVAAAFASQLGFADRVASIKWFNSVDPLEPPSAETLRQNIVNKNDLWFRYWRPTNWAFLYGNRQTQPSSRDHKNPSQRWFPVELKAALLHLNKAEQRIDDAAKAVSRFRPPYSKKDVDPLFAKHCIRCHNGTTQKGAIRLDNVRLDFARERELWDKIEEQIVTNKMPPEKPFLSDDQRLSITDWISAQKDKVDWSAHRQAGHVALPLLNRTEYENTVRALFNDRAFNKSLTHIDFFRSLPDDGVGDTGFSSDRDSPSLAMTGARLEKYVRVTEDVLDHYLYTDRPVTYEAEAEKMKATTAVLTPTENGIMIKANRDSLYTRWHYPRSGWYIIKVKAWGERIDNRACAEMVIYLDRKEVGQVRLLATRAQPGDYHCLVWIEKGHHTLRFRPQRAGTTKAESLLSVPPPFPDKPVIADFNDLGLGTGVYMCMDKMEIHGPVNQLPEEFNRNEHYREGLTGPPTRSIITQQNTPAVESRNDLAWEKQTGLTINREVSHEKISNKYTNVWVLPLVKTDFSSPPPTARLIAADGDGRIAARQVISRFAAKAFRRPVGGDDIDFFLKFYDATVIAGAGHRAGLKSSLFAIMISPDFFYRIPQNRSETEERRLDSFEMASRLSYFLWNSMPDEELFALAKANKLTDPKVIDSQVVRMLKSTSGKRAAGVFAREWLGYRELGVTIKPDETLFKNTYYANNIESLLKEETETFVKYIFSENRPLEELVTADYAFWNKRLAQYYPGSNDASELLAASIHGSPDVDIAVPNGNYTLQLLLYEGWQSRSADIVIEGKTIRKAYNMLDAQGSTFDHGSVLRYAFTLTDGNIDIKFNEHSPNIHLGGMILTKGNGQDVDSTAIVKSNSDLDFQDVVKAINFGDTRNLSIGNVTFTAAAVNTTVDGVTNKAAGDVYAGQFSQKLPTILKDKSHVQLGDDLVKVHLPETSSRGGLLGMGSILAVTSHPTRTSAVDRGLWVYEKLFGKHLPDPPVVPALAKGTGEVGATRTFREVLEKHRENKQCASCHNKIDPIGFGLENFDPIGRWRQVDGGKPIDATGVLPNGGSFEGPRELKQRLVRDKVDFYRNMTQTVLTYALGRKLKYYDRPVVDKIVQQLLRTGGQSHELFKMVAKSYPFTHASSSSTSVEESK